MLLNHTLEIMGGISLFAGFVSGIAGASGIIILPALLMVGMSPHFALGTTRLYTTATLFSSAVYYIKRGHFKPKNWLPSILAATFGAIAGVILALFLSAAYLKKVLPILIMLVCIYMLIPKKNHEDKLACSSQPYSILTMLVSMLLGTYSGFLGAGTGSIWTSAATEFLKMDIVEANAISRFMCFVTNLVALVVYISLNKIDYLVGVELAIFGAIGALIGSRVAMYLGAKFIRMATIMAALVMMGNLAFCAWS